MPAARPPENEQGRLDRLRRLAVLDSEAEPLFDALTRAAAAVTGKPIALIGLMDADRQWFKSNVGLPGVSETPRAGAMCAHTILGTDLLEVADVRQDPRFADSPLVNGPPNVRFYAGVPIILHDGFSMGTLCVIDQKPGALDEQQRDTLRTLGQAAADALELRRYARAEHAALDRETQALRDQKETDKLLATRLRESEAFLERTGRLAKVGGWELNLATNELVWSDQTCRIHDLPAGHQPTLEEAVKYYAPEYRSVIRSALAKAIADGDDWDLQLPMVTASGRSIWARTVGAAIYDDDGQPVRLAGAFQDVTTRASAVAALEASDRRYRKLFEHSLGLICTHDHEGTVLSINPAAAKSLGFSVAELIGCPLTSRMRPERFPAFHDYLLRVMRNGSDSGMLEFVAKDGSLRIWEYHNVRDADEKRAANVVNRLDADRNDAPIAFTLGAVTMNPGQSLESGMAEADRRLYKAREGRHEQTR